MIKYPVMIDSGGTEVKRLHPVSLSVNKQLDPLSTASMELTPDETLNNYDRVMIYTPDDNGEIYIVKGVSTDVSTGSQSVSLEHCACTLENYIIPGEVRKKETIASLLTYILGFQQEWTAGTVQATNTIYIDLGGMNLLDAITTIMPSIPQYMLVFNPDWTVDILERPTLAESEVRLSRNLESCTIDYSGNDICTRLYAAGLPGGYLDSSNVSVYGLHEEEQMLNDGLSAAQKLAIAQAYLDAHDHPKVSIEISGVELAQITGLALDRFNVGTVCRCAIPWLNVTESEVIVSKSYPDLLGFPEQVMISLANAKPDLSISVAQIARGGRGNAKTIQKQNKRYETKFEQSDEYFRLLATDTQWDEMGQGTLTAYGQIVLNSSSIQNVVSKTGINSLGESETLYSQITQNANSITQEVARATGAEGSLSSRITQTESDIALVVTGTGADRGINSASIILAINGTGGSSAIISADKVDLQGYVTATELATNGAYITEVTADSVVVAGGDVTIDTNGISCANLDVNGTDLSGIGSSVSAVRITGPTNNVYKLQYQTYDDDTWTDAGTFSRATTLRDGWSGDTYTVTATQDGTQVGQKSTKIYISHSPGGAQYSNFDAMVYHDSIAGGNEVLTKKVYLVDNTASSRVEARWETSSGTVIAAKRYTGGTVRSVTALAPTGTTTYASNVYTIPADVTYDSGSNTTSSINVPISIGNYQSSSSGVGYYRITVAGNNERTLTPTGAYQAGQTAGITKSNITISSIAAKSTQYTNRDRNVTLNIGTNKYILVTIVVGSVTYRLQITDTSKQ